MILNLVILVCVAVAAFFGGRLVEERKQRKQPLYSQITILTDAYFKQLAQTEALADVLAALGFAVEMVEGDAFMISPKTDAATALMKSVNGGATVRFQVLPQKGAK